MRGELLELKYMINAFAEFLSVLVPGVIRVAHEAGIDGALGGKVEAPAYGGWKDLRDSVNTMVANWTST